VRSTYLGICDSTQSKIH
jgi:hypothetical protein